MCVMKDIFFNNIDNDDIYLVFFLFYVVSNSYNDSVYLYMLIVIG